MIFLIDENLSPQITTLHSSQHEAIHINQLKPHKEAVIKDDFIRKLSLNHPFVLVTKDDDFVKSWVDRKVPEKLVFIYDDFESLKQLLQSYKKNIPSLESLLINVDFITFSSEGIKTPFEVTLPYKKDQLIDP